MESERKETLFRIFTIIVDGIILYFWSMLFGILLLFNLLWSLVMGTRNKAVSDFQVNYTMFVNQVLSYVSGASDERPFPFAKQKTVVVKKK